MHHVADVAYRVSRQAGLVNLGIINTPLPAYSLGEEEHGQDCARKTHGDVKQRVNDIGVEAMRWLNLHGKAISFFSSGKT